VRDRYSKVLGMTKESQKRRTNENVNKINEDMRKKEKGLTLAEKIEKLIEKVKKKEVISHIDDAFFQE
jgi:chromatin segregation and condensation protein Rec8/ScpA/Scc1 (kleisin family)